MKLKLMTFAVAAAFGSFMQRRGLAVGALSVSLDKGDYEKLTKEAKAFYVEKDGKFVLDLPEGWEDAKGMKSALEKERARAKTEEAARKALELKFADIDPEEVKAILERAGTEEERKLLKEGKIDVVVAQRMEKAQKAHEKALKAAEDKVAAANTRADKFAAQVLDNHVRQASTKLGLHANAVEDALFRARTIFKLDENGNAVQLDADGKAVMGKDGKTAFAPVEWLEGMKESAPHWFPAGGTGGGANGSKQSGSVVRLSRADFNKLTPVDQATRAKEAGEGKIQIVD